MRPFLRRRVRGWDWFTPRAIQHLPWRDRERLTQEAWETVHRHPRYRLMCCWLPLLGCLAMFFAGVVPLPGMSPVIGLSIDLFFMVLIASSLVWQSRRFREALRQKLLDAGIRSGFCFECGCDLEGYEGKECPACGVPLLRQADSPPESS